MAIKFERRRLLGAGLGIATATMTSEALSRKGGGSEKKTAAVEDLMREHGVLRRALLVYVEATRRLRNGGPAFPAHALMRTARLFRSFGEDYHERALEEQYVFPRAARLKGEAARLPDVLKTQHDRGREITDYVLSVTSGGSIASANAASLAATLDGFVLMYQHHTALEDTVLFPAWKQALPDSEYHELSERFEELEHKMFGKDGFEDALKRIAQIEHEVGVSDLARFTAARPPRPLS